MWLYHFRVGEELQSGSKKKAHGIGHAMRCLSLIRAAELPASIVTSDNEQARTLLEKHGLEYNPEDKLEELLSSNEFDMVISDINYLKEEFFNLYKKYCPCTCLAPRGQGKYLADLAFKDVWFEDEPPVKARVSRIYAGPAYAVTGPGFALVRQQLEAGEIVKQPRTIFLSMGGVDQFDLTAAAVEGLKGLTQDWNLRIILGRFYPYEDKLKSLIQELSCQIELYCDPPDLYSLLAESSFCVVASGLISYEAIGLGTPAVNFNLTDFHEKRSQELEDMGVGVNGGAAFSVSKGLLSEIVFFLAEDFDKVTEMRKHGMELVDGQGAYRIVDIIKTYLSKYN